MTTITNNTNIVRRPDFAGGGITEEEKKLFATHAKLWIKRIMRTKPINEKQITVGVKELYAAAGLKEPRVVVVPAPSV